MIKKIFIAILRLILWLIVVALVATLIVLFFPGQTNEIKGASVISNALQSIKTNMDNVQASYSASALDDAGVFALTNAERRKQGLPILTENSKLDQAALNKAKDMFTNQYFEHVSPITGKGPGNIDTDAGYSYFVVGENLAEGDFTSDADLLAAWMASPGHRANILNADYRELGVAVLKGTYQGQTVWMAVQEFGVSTSVCTQTDPSLKAEIDSDKATLASEETDLASQKAAIANYEPKGDSIYNAMISRYNSAVDTYNSLVASSKVLINQYNAEADAYNACATKNGASSATTVPTTEAAE